MVSDHQARRLTEQVRAGKPLAVAAARAGMCERTAGKYRRLGRLPSECRIEHTWRTRDDPFAQVWPDVRELLTANPGLQAKALFADLQRRCPGRFADGRRRTPHHLNPARRHMLLDADDLKDRGQLPLLFGELGCEAAFQMREQDGLNVAPDGCYLGQAFAPWLVLIACTPVFGPGRNAPIERLVQLAHLSTENSRHNGAQAVIWASSEVFL